MSNTTTDLLLRTETQEQLAGTAGRRSAAFDMIGWLCLVLLFGYVGSLGFAYPSVSDWYWQLPAAQQITLGCACTGLAIVIGLGALGGFALARMAQAESRLQRMVIDLPLAVKQGLYQFVGGSQEDFERARGQVRLYDEIDRVEKTFDHELQRLTDIVTSALYMYDKHGGLTGTIEKADATMTTAKVVQLFLETRGDMRLGPELAARADELEAAMRQFTSGELPTANTTPAE